MNQHVVCIHTVEDVLAQLLPSHLGPGGCPRVGARRSAAGTPGRLQVGDPQLPHGNTRFAFRRPCNIYFGRASGTGAERDQGTFRYPPLCLVTSIELRQCASLMDASFAQALEMVHWSYCGAAAAELGAWPFCVPLGTDVLRHNPQDLLLAASPARRPLVLGPLSRTRRTPPGPSLLGCDGAPKGSQRVQGSRYCRC